MSNLIAERVAHFLRQFPPFNELPEKKGLELAGKVEILYIRKGARVFKKGEGGHNFFYVVHQGAVELKPGAEEAVMDVCDEGDLFGLRPLIAQEAYQLEAVAREESILYAIPLETFNPLMLEYPGLNKFLLESFASNTRNPYSQSFAGKLLSGKEEHSPSSPSLGFSELQLITSSRPVVSCTENTTIKAAAALMRNENVSSILVVENNCPIGILTDKDFRNKVVTGASDPLVAVGQIMTSPVITYPKKITLSRAQLAMMKNDISHLCLTEDGTDESSVVGVISKYDLLLAMGNNPEIIMKAIKRARQIKELIPIRQQITRLLQGYLEQDIPMNIILMLIGELNDACTKQLIQLVLKKQQTPPPVPFAFLSMGSHGRGEQLLPTDQDNAILFADVPESKLSETTAYFLGLGKKINKSLKTLGYDYCPADMMASDANWCFSLSEWKEKVSHWIINPGQDEVLLSSIFFDYNLSFGDRGLVKDLSEYLFKSVHKYPVFFFHLASGALQNPSPTGFFRQFIVEQDGEHKDKFDIKRRVLMPFTDAARVLILSHSIKSINHTAARFEKLAELEPQNEELYRSCAQATKALLKFRTVQGITQDGSGRYLNLEALSKEDKITLKQAFKTLKEIQELVAIRFKVSNLLG